MTEDEIDDLAEQLVKKMKVSEEKAKEEQMIVGEERDMWMESELHVQCNASRST